SRARRCANAWHHTATTRTDLALRLDHHLLMRQMIELEGATGAALVPPHELQGRIGFVVLRLILGERSFQVLQRERQLIVANAFGLAAEVRAADLCQNGLELGVS